MSLSILVSDSNRNWSDEVQEYLRSNSYNIETCLNGKDCQLKVYRHNYMAIILDIDTIDHSGLEVLKDLRLNIPSMKIILSINSNQRLKEIGLKRKDLLKLGASDILIKPYSFEILLESIEGISQLRCWNEGKGHDSLNNAQAIDAEDSDFSTIKIEDFGSGNAAIFDCYVKIQDNIYVKVLQRGEFFDERLIEKYLNDHKITHLYFKTLERGDYIEFMNNLIEKKHESRGPVTSAEMIDTFISDLYTQGLSQSIIKEGKNICQKIFKNIQSNPGLNNLLERYEDEDPSAFSNLFLVSFISVIICRKLKWSSQRTVELVAFGGLLHDIGKLKLPNNLKGIGVEAMDEEQLKKFKVYPTLGAELLQEHPVVTEPVRQIVYQHSEYVNGKGFPNGLTGIKIYPLAKVVSLAADFAKYMSKKGIPPVQALREFVPDREKILRYDPLIVKALIKGFSKNAS